MQSGKIKGGIYIKFLRTLAISSALMLAVPPITADASSTTFYTWEGDYLIFMQPGFKWEDLDKYAKPATPPPSPAPVVVTSQTDMYGDVISPEVLAAIDYAAKKHSLDPLLIRAVMRQESGFQQHIVSSAGACGYMQLMPATAKSMGVEDGMIFDTYQNIDAGVKYLKFQIDHFGSLDLGLAAYNAGPGAVQKYGGIPPYQETQNYVKNINAMFKRYRDKQLEELQRQGKI